MLKIEPLSCSESLLRGETYFSLNDPFKCLISCIIYTSVFLKKSCLKKNMFCVVFLEHSRIYICCSTVQNICCSSNVSIPSCESSPAGSTHVLQGCSGCNYKDMEVRAHGTSKWFWGGTLQILNCPVNISFIANASVLWWNHGWWPLLSHIPSTVTHGLTLSLRLDFFICKIRISRLTWS